MNWDKFHLYEKARGTSHERIPGNPVNAPEAEQPIPTQSIAAAAVLLVLVAIITPTKDPS